MKTCGCKRSRSGEERSKTPVYKLAIIDFDGTICSTHDAVRHVIDLTFASFDRPAPDAAEVESAIGSGAVASDLFGGLLGLEPDDPERAAWAGRYREIYNGGEGLALTELFPGVREGLESLAAAGCRSIVLSNKGETSLAPALRHFGIDEHFEMVIGDAPGFVRKPRPDSYHTLIAPRFPDIRPEQTFMLGDTETDIRFARNIGVPAFWARYGFGNAETCKALKPERTLDAFNAAADFATAAS